MSPGGVRHTARPRPATDDETLAFASRGASPEPATEVLARIDQDTRDANTIEFLSAPDLFLKKLARLAKPALGSDHPQHLDVDHRLPLTARWSTGATGFDTGDGVRRQQVCSDLQLLADSGQFGNRSKGGEGSYNDQPWVGPGFTSTFASKDSVTIESPGGGGQLPFGDAGGKPLADKDGEVTLEPNRVAT